MKNLILSTHAQEMWELRFPHLNIATEKVVQKS